MADERLVPTTGRRDRDLTSEAAHQRSLKSKVYSSLVARIWRNRGRCST